MSSKVHNIRTWYVVRGLCSIFGLWRWTSNSIDCELSSSSFPNLWLIYNKYDVRLSWSTLRQLLEITFTNLFVHAWYWWCYLPYFYVQHLCYLALKMVVTLGKLDLHKYKPSCIKKKIGEIWFFLSGQLHELDVDDLRSQGQSSGHTNYWLNWSQTYPYTSFFHPEPGAVVGEFSFFADTNIISLIENGYASDELISCVNHLIEEKKFFVTNTVLNELCKNIDFCTNKDNKNHGDNILDARFDRYTHLSINEHWTTENEDRSCTIFGVRPERCTK